MEILETFILLIPNMSEKRTTHDASHNLILALEVTLFPTPGNMQLDVFSGRTQGLQLNASS